MCLCETLHGRRPWPELELPWEPMGSSPERERRGRGGRGRGLGAAWGEGGLQEGAARSSWLLGAAVLCPAPEEEQEEREKKKRKEKKRKKGKNFKLENFQGEK
jgi:hypothetical protein